MSTFYVYGSYYGSSELPELVATSATRAEAEAIVATAEEVQMSEQLPHFDFYLIAEEFGDSVRFTSDAMLSGA
jgi:hypothetical protein